MGALWVKIQGSLIIVQKGFKMLFDGCTLGEDPGESHSGICNYVLSVLVTDPLRSNVSICQSDKYVSGSSGVPHTDKKMKQGTGPRGKGGTGGDGGKGGKGKTGKVGKTGKDRGRKGEMPPPEIPRHLGDDPKTVIGNKANTVRRCDQQGVTNGNSATDTYMVVGRRVVKFSDAIRIFPGKCIPSMMSTFQAPHNFRFCVCVDCKHNNPKIRARHSDFSTGAHDLPAGYEAKIKQLFV